MCVKWVKYWEVVPRGSSAQAAADKQAPVIVSSDARDTRDDERVKSSRLVHSAHCDLRPQAYSSSPSRGRSPRIILTRGQSGVLPSYESVHSS